MTRQNGSGVQLLTEEQVLSPTRYWQEVNRGVRSGNHLYLMLSPGMFQTAGVEPTVGSPDRIKGRGAPLRQGFLAVVPAPRAP